MPPHFSPPEYSSALAAELRRQREAAGLSQNKLSKLSGISRTMLTHVEREMRLPTVETLARLAAGLGTTPAMILCAVENIEVSKSKNRAKK